jgi:hypothetical protein
LKKGNQDTEELGNHTICCLLEKLQMFKIAKGEGKTQCSYESCPQICPQECHVEDRGKIKKTEGVRE